jgi:hypothetical protein
MCAVPGRARRGYARDPIAIGRDFDLAPGQAGRLAAGASAELSPGSKAIPWTLSSIPRYPPDRRDRGLADVSATLLDPTRLTLAV